MIAGCIRDGIGSAVRRPGLVLLLWAWNLLLGLVVALPAFTWWSAAFNFSGAADTMRDRFDMAVLADLGKYDQLPGFGMLTSATLGVMIIAFIAGAFINGGILEVLATEDDRRSLMHRFFRGGGHFFGRFLRLLIPTLIGALIVSAIVAAVTSAAAAPIAESDWDPAGFVAGMINLLMLALVWGYFLLAQDYARIQIARDDGRRVLRAWVHALGFVLRRLFATFAIGLAIAVMSAVLLGVWILYDGSMSSATWPGILALVLVQQVLLFGRTGLRVALIGAERQYDLRTVQPAVRFQPPTPLAVDRTVPTPDPASTEAQATEAERQ
jgi:hypothetical protein